ncbi:hypothetical protein DF182_15605 [Chitinophaga flava]|uniref:Uncharacterized protein n=1 Tax=Chitinophaga flava TaxID=2259036 RepID=A0A365Y5Q0_9BACT|nr:hypothetical protein DF182_15605 [Chitinophaga flava]
MDAFFYESSPAVFFQGQRTDEQVLLLFLLPPPALREYFPEEHVRYMFEGPGTLSGLRPGYQTITEE